MYEHSLITDIDNDFFLSPLVLYIVKYIFKSLLNQQLKLSL